MNQPTSLAEGRYLLVEQLGEGGMATVYRAFDQRLQVWRAVKILSPDYADKKKIRRRFEAEAQTMALLEHRNIVRVYDVGREGNVAYIVMELLLGGCLVDWLEHHGAMPPRLAVEATIQTCDGVSAAHDKGVIHRDIKPHNVLVTSDGVCRVTDFGIARVGDSETSMTKTGSVMGTWGYMAPEQRTNAKGVDVRADVYALGATLYSLLTDRMPMDLFAMDRDSSILEGVHELLVPILVKSSEYDREARYASVAEFKQALIDVLPKLPELPEGTPPLAVESRENPAPPDPTLYESPAGDPRKIAATGATLMPGEMSRGSTEPTILPDGTELGSADTEYPDGVAVAQHMTMPPEEVAVTQPGAITRQNRPTFKPGINPEANLPTVIHDETDEAPMTRAAITVDKPGPVTGGGGGGASTMMAGATLFVSLTTAVVVLVLAGIVGWQAMKPPPPVPDPVPIEKPDPVPKEEPTAKPEPTEDPAPSGPKPSGPKPAPAGPRPQPVTAPVAPPPDPAPAPAPAAPCVEAGPVTVTSTNKLLFIATWCGSGPADKNLRVSVHYRPAGSGAYTTKDLKLLMGKYQIGIPWGQQFDGGVDYYFDGWGGSSGSAGSPKHFKR